jgi:hypothetical protein
MLSPRLLELLRAAPCLDAPSRTSCTVFYGMAKPVRAPQIGPGARTVISATRRSVRIGMMRSEPSGREHDKILSGKCLSLLRVPLRKSVVTDVESASHL